MYMTPVNLQEARSNSTSPQLPLRPSARGPAFRINVLKSLRLHAVTAVLVTLVVLGLGLAFLLRRGASYLSTSTIYVSPTFPKTLIEDRETEYPYDSYVQQQVHSITRYEVLQDALRHLPPGVWRRPGETERSAIERLQKELILQRVGLTYQVSISLYRPTPDHLADIVNAVTQAYLSKAKDEEFFGRDDRLATLRQSRDDIRKELDARIEEETQITQGLGVAKVGDDGGNIFDGQLDKKRDSLATAHEQRVQAEAALSSLKNSDPSAPNAALNSKADEIIASDPGLMALKNSIAQRRADLVTKLAGLTPNHPQHKQVEDELAQTDKELQNMQNDLRRKAATKIEEQLRAEVNRTSTIEAKLNGDLQQQSSVAASAAPKLQRAGELKIEIDRLQNRYGELDQRINNLELESSSPGSIHLFASALPPLGPESSKTKILIPALFPISILFGIAVAVAFDLLDPHVHNGSDVEGVLGFTPLGVLLDDRDITQRVFDECTLRLAAGIDHAVRAGGARTFVVTSVGAGGGTTSIVESMGSTLARLGHKTLTIDASGHSEPVAYVTLGVNDSTAESSLGSGFLGGDGAQAAPSMKLQQTTPFSRMTPAKAPPIYNFVAKTFQNLTNEYDVVLIDAAPLLISAETEYLSRSADVTILVAEAGKTSKRKLTRAARLLERLDVSGVAAVVNKVRLARAEEDLQHDLRESEARLSEMNLRWRPHHHSKPMSAAPSPFDPGVEEASSQEPVGFAANHK